MSPANDDASDLRRIQLSRRKGWRMPAGTVKVDRSTKFGNPHTIVGSSREEAVARFERDLQRFGCIPSHSASRDATTVGEIKRELRGKNLACWCALDAHCHADVLLRIANDARNEGTEKTPRNQQDADSSTENAAHMEPK